MEIKLNNLLHLTENDLKKTKIRFNKYNGTNNPLQVYLEDPETVNNRWLFWKENNCFFDVGNIAICLVDMGGDNWLLTTIKTVTKKLDVETGIAFEGEEIIEYKPYFGRVVVKYHKDAQASVRKACDFIDELIVTNILPDVYTGQAFSGYDKVKLSFKELENIINKHKIDWITALENQKAVYLIADKNTGKLYVGSATSDKGMLLSRWKDYIKSGHGGNIKLKDVINEKGFDYIKNNFQYSILEVFNSKIDDKIVLERENWWKETLLTRNEEVGYNAN